MPEPASRWEHAERLGVARVNVLDVDVAVVGAGPAGLAAATTAAAAGLRVAVVDAALQPGGQYWRHPDENAAAAAKPPADEGHGHHDWQHFIRWREQFYRLADQGAIRYLPGRQVWFLERSSELFVLRVNDVVDREDPRDADGPGQVRARSLILCPGGYDRQLPIPGWDLPGAMAAGGVQALLKGHRSLAGRRAVVAGTGPFLLPVAVGLAEAGAEVLGICEAAAITNWTRHLGGAVQVPAKGLEAVSYARDLLRHRIPYRTRTAVVEISGDAEVTGVTTARLDAAGRVLPGSEQRIEADLVALGWGFTPSLELIVAAGADTRRDVDRSLVAVVDDRQQSTVPGVYVAGEATGVGGATLAVLEGELAAMSVAADHRAAAGGRGRVTSLQRAIRRSRAFARSMHLAHPVPPRWSEWLTEETLVCRCEEVTHAQLCEARDELGAQDARTVKLLARTGMGWCQGRVCGFATAELAAGSSGRDPTVAELQPVAKRPLCAPVSLGELADLDAEFATASTGRALDTPEPPEPVAAQRPPGEW